MATMTSKGQITIPKNVRQALGLAPGSKVDFVLEDGRAVVRKRPPAEALKRWEGYLRGNLPGGSVDKFIEMLRGEPLDADLGLNEDRGR